MLNIKMFSIYHAYILGVCVCVCGGVRCFIYLYIYVNFSVNDKQK